VVALKRWGAGDLWRKRLRQLRFSLPSQCDWPGLRPFGPETRHRRVSETALAPRDGAFARSGLVARIAITAQRKANGCSVPHAVTSAPAKGPVRLAQRKTRKDRPGRRPSPGGAGDDRVRSSRFGADARTPWRINQENPIISTVT